MLIRFQKYHALFSKGLLLAGYLFFFASQFNGRYFTIANFYVYHGNGNSPVIAYGGVHGRVAYAVTATAVARTAARQHPIALHDNSQRPAHLGIDKRYQGNQGIRIPQIRAPGVICFGIVKTHCYSFKQVYFSTAPPTRSLRGPPCA